MKKNILTYLFFLISIFAYSQTLHQADFDTFETIWQLDGEEPMEIIESSKCEMVFDEIQGRYLFKIYSEELGVFYQGYDIVVSNQDKVIAKMVTLNADMPDLYIVKDSIASKGKIEFIKKNNVTESGERLFFIYRYSTVSN